ncbi:unnamed protein product, partial [Prunus brigantina]
LSSRRLDISLPLLGEFSRTLLLSSRQIIRIRTILLSSLDILGKGQTTNFFRILAQQQLAATVASTGLRLPVTTSTSLVPSSWSSPRKREDEEKYTCSTFLGMHRNSSLPQAVQILQVLSQARK